MSVRGPAKKELLLLPVRQVRWLVLTAEIAIASRRGFILDDQMKRDLCDWEETLAVRKKALAEMESKA
jgi:hypothetical protein